MDQREGIRELTEEEIDLVGGGKGAGKGLGRFFQLAAKPFTNLIDLIVRKARGG
jgi:hypothetical protein